MSEKNGVLLLIIVVLVVAMALIITFPEAFNKIINQVTNKMSKTINGA